MPRIFLTGLCAVSLFFGVTLVDAPAFAKERKPAKNTANKESKVKPESLEVLSKADRFYSELIGEGARSTVYDAYSDCLRRIDSIRIDDLTWLKNNGTPGGKLYGGFLLLHKDQAKGREAFVDFLNDNTQLEYQSGCEVLQATVGGIARNIMRTGRFLDFRDGIAVRAPMYVQELLVAERLADATPGESGPHREYLVFSAAKQSLNELKNEDLRYILSKATPAGKIYAAALLTLKGSDKTAFDSLLKDKSQVIYTSGCKGFGTPLNEVAKQLKETGKFFGFSVKPG